MNQAHPAPPQAEGGFPRLGLASQAYRDFYARCFWSYRQDLEITADNLALVIRGLREHGGRAGYRIAAELCR